MTKPNGEMPPEINPSETDPTLRVLASEFALGINADHVFGDEPVSSRRRSVAAENMTRMIVERDGEGGLKVYFKHPDGSVTE